MYYRIKWPFVLGPFFYGKVSSKIQQKPNCGATRGIFFFQRIYRFGSGALRLLQRWGQCSARKLTPVQFWTPKRSARIRRADDSLALYWN
jgi:hypothetical protein